MKPENRLLLAVAAGFTILTAAVLYTGYRIERSVRSSPGGSPQDRAGAPQPIRSDTPQGAAAARPRAGRAKRPVRLNRDGIPVDRVVTYDTFLRLWQPKFAALAERNCWTPLERKYQDERLDDTAHFYVTVSADGRVIAVDPDLHPDKQEHKWSPKLNRCLAKIIRTMKFPAPGKETRGRVQANRPQKPRPRNTGGP